MAKAKVDPAVAAEELAVQTLCAALGKPADPLFAGSAAKIKAAAEMAIKRGWVAISERTVGKKKVKEYRITPIGIQHAILHGESVQLIQSMSDAVTSSRSAISEMASQVARLQQDLQSQTAVLEKLIQRIVPPNLDELLKKTPSSDTVNAGATNARADQQALADQIIAGLRDFKRRANVGQLCPLKDLYNSSAQKLGATLGEFHECLRELDHQRKIRLAPWGGPMYELQDDRFALVLGKEVKFYADLDQ